MVGITASNTKGGEASGMLPTFCRRFSRQKVMTEILMYSPVPSPRNAYPFLDSKNQRQSTSACLGSTYRPSLISMCENRKAMLVSVMDGQRPQIRCEGRFGVLRTWAARYGVACGRNRGFVSQGVASGVRGR